MSDNPYESPGNEQRDVPSTLPPSTSARIGIGLKNGAVFGLVIGAGAAALLAAILTESTEYLLGDVIVSSITGAILGCLGCCALGVCVALVSYIVQQNERQIVRLAATVGGSCVGLLGGTAQAILMTGSGIEGTPISSLVLVGCVVGAIFGSVAGFLIGVRLSVVH